MIMHQLYKTFFYDQNATILSIQILDFGKEIEDCLKTNFLERNEYSAVPLQHSRADAADKFTNKRKFFLSFFILNLRF